MQNYLKLLVLLLIPLISCAVYGQEGTVVLNGKVRSLKNDVSSILVVNLNSNKSTITDAVGLFAIEVKLRDTIRFAAVQYLTKEIIITDVILAQKMIDVVLVENVIKLSEVTVMPYNLTGKIDLDINRLGIEPAVSSSSLGLPNADVEVMTQSERLLLEADRGKYVRLMTIEDQGKVIEAISYLQLGIIINTHKIMNRVSGRTKSFEDMVVREENLELENEIITMFSKTAMSEEFDIPESDIDNFLTFCLYQTDFHLLSEAANSMEIWEYLRKRSNEFKNTDSIKD